MKFIVTKKWQKEFSALIEANTEDEARAAFSEFDTNYDETSIKEVTQVTVVSVPENVQNTSPTVETVATVN